MWNSELITSEKEVAIYEEVKSWLLRESLELNMHYNNCIRNCYECMCKLRNDNCRQRKIIKQLKKVAQWKNLVIIKHTLTHYENKKKGRLNHDSREESSSSSSSDESSRENFINDHG